MNLCFTTDQRQYYQHIHTHIYAWITMDPINEVAEKFIGTSEVRPSEESEPSTQKKADSQALCTCPQKCFKRVPINVKERLLKEFNNLSDSAKQNEYLQSYIEMRSVYKRLWSEEERVGGRLQRRVSCKYKIPLEDQEPFDVSCHPPAPKIHTNSKGQPGNVVNVKQDVRTIEVCQKAFMNIYGITEKRIRLQREKLIAKLRKDGATEANGHIKETQWTPEQAILDAFFGNQLWRPEYIGMSTDSKANSTQNVKV